MAFRDFLVTPCGLRTSDLNTEHVDMVVERQLTLQAAKAALKRVPPQRAAPSPTRRPPVTSPPPQALVSRVEPITSSRSQPLHGRHKPLPVCPSHIVKMRCPSTREEAATIRTVTTSEEPHQKRSQGHPACRNAMCQTGLAPFVWP